MRISKKELDAAVFKPKQNKVLSQDSVSKVKDQVVLLYDINGNICQFENDKFAAKKITSPRGNEYFLKINCNGQIFNPFNKQYGDESFRIAKQQGLSKDKVYKLIKCSKAGFDNYLEYLKTKNITFLNQAERGVI